jgi:hypothetical protein
LVEQLHREYVAEFDTPQTPWIGHQQTVASRCDSNGNRSEAGRSGVDRLSYTRDICDPGVS